MSESSKDGCLITSKGIYIHNTLTKTKKYLFQDISMIEIKGAFLKEISINGYELQTTVISSNASKVRFCSMLNKIKSDLTVKIDTKTLLNQGANSRMDNLIEYAIESLIVIYRMLI